MAIRRQPHVAWFYFWLVALPIGVFIFFLGQWVINAIVYKLKPLQVKDPALTAHLEQMVDEPARTFLQDPSTGWVMAKNPLDAYVTGLSTSKRMVGFH